MNFLRSFLEKFLGAIKEIFWGAFLGINFGEFIVSFPREILLNFLSAFVENLLRAIKENFWRNSRRNSKECLETFSGKFFYGEILERNFEEFLEYIFATHCLLVNKYV